MPAAPLIGAHIRVAGGLASAGIRNATKSGAEAVQVFVANPQGWATRPGDSAADAAFREHMEAADIPVYVHAPYLVNFGSPTPETVRRSGLSLAHSLRRGQEIGARGVIVHTGSAVAAGEATVALTRVREHLLPLLDTLPDRAPDVLLEPTAGQGQSLCATVDELPLYLANLDWHPRLGVCLDTCHLFAAGHDLTAAGGVDAVLAPFHETVSPARLRLVHANDSVDVCGSRRDRHANIGQGEIGARPFAEFLAHPVMRPVPMLVETPGTVESHREDVALLQRLRHEGARSQSGQRH